MGVPKFFRYISERYPCLSEIVKEYQIPEFDNLYLDMNGIIHTCSHPDDGDPHFRITEEKIFQDIFHYIEVLFRMIKPRKLFFMAVDGVAPRAKMNQQRGRRFRSAKEALSLEAKARERGETLPTEARFDSNCITPGTLFMARLHEQLKYFVVNKISTDKQWHKCKVILSGHETPGEGEHKIMDYIRYMRTQPGYDPNTRHCLYGLDADLIMLGLCTHEPHFSLLREEVQFGRKSTKRKNVPEQITFFLLHLSLMREYLELEFYPLKDSLSFNYDMEKIIDDWVLMGFLVGNDFIPNLPNMHIVNGALPLLYNAYMKILPKLGGYINEEGTLNLQRFEMFMQELSNIDIESFSEKYADLKWFEAKTGRRFDENEKPELKKLEAWEDGSSNPFGEALESIKNADPGLASLIKATEDFMLEPSSSNHGKEEDEVCKEERDSNCSDTDDDLLNSEFIQHKADYYMNKLEYENVTPEVLKSQAEEYVRAIQWNLNYYYNGVCSWSWYYPHHYAPYTSDIKGFSNLTFNFELGEPFRPYEQLLAVLPVASKSLLPLPYQELMTNEDSPIKEYYPENFKTDLNGKRQEWEAVVLIPFISEDILLKAMEPCSSRLTPEETKRNSHGPMLVYQYSEEDLGEYCAPEYFSLLKESHANCTEVSIKDIRVPKHKLIKGTYPGAKFDVYYPGFPTMKHLKYEGTLEKWKVKVFEQPSRGDNMILHVKKEKLPNCETVAKKYLGKVVHVGWPHLVEALVVSVSNCQRRYHTVGDKGQYNIEENRGNLASQWAGECQGIIEHNRNRLGIDVGVIEMLMHVKVMTGRKYIFTPQGRISLEKQWADITSAYPVQAVVSDIAVYEEKYAAYTDMNSIFPTGSTCYMIGHPFYGSLGEVLDSKDCIKNGRLKLSIKKHEEPNLSSVIQFDNDVRVRFMSLHVASTKLGISKSLFSRLTGCIYVSPGINPHNIATDDIPKINIGLNLKFNKRNEEIPGYTRKEGNTWLYSEKAVNLVCSYLEKFPDVFKFINRNVTNDVYFEEEMFPDKENAKDILKEITAWIKQQPFYALERQVCGSSTLDPESIQLLERVIDDYNSEKTAVKQVVLQVRAFLLFKAELQMGNLMPDPSATFQLFDRVVNVRDGYTVPAGLRGTIIGIHMSGTFKEIETTYDVLFDEPFLGGLSLNCSSNRGYRMPKPAIINVSHGQRIYEQKTGKAISVQSIQQRAPPKPAPPKPAPLKVVPAKLPPPKLIPPKVVPQKLVLARQTPLQQAPPQQTPLQQVPPKQTPAQPTPPQQTPAQPTPPQQTPAQPTPPQQTSAQPAPPQQTSAQPAPPQQNVSKPTTVISYIAPNTSFPTPLTPFRPNQFHNPAAMFQNWSQGCSYSQPLPNPVYNYSPNFTPNFGNPYVHPLYNANYVNPTGPNTFVPYKSNQFLGSIGPPPPPVPSNFIPVPIPRNIPTMSDVQQSVKKEEQGFGDSQKPFIVSAVPNVPSTVIYEFDSDVLRKMLKINEENKANTKDAKQQDGTVPNAVSDFFAAHAKAKDQQNTPTKDQESSSSSKTSYYTAQLQSEFQLQGLGSPSYQFFEANNKITAKITLPDGRSIFGKPARTKEEACENVAAETLPHILKANEKGVVSTPVKPPSEAVPEPPRKWQGAAQAQLKNPSSPQKNRSKTKGNISTLEFKRGGDIKLLGQLDNNVTTTRSRNNGGKTDKKQQSTSQFVPLQVTRHRSRTNSSSTNAGTGEQKEHASSTSQKQKTTGQSSQGTSTGSSGNVMQSNAKTNSAKPRRQRKMRIAANFQSTIA